MTPLFKKLNLGALRAIHVLNAPASFETELAQLEGVTVRQVAIDADWSALRFRKAEFIKTVARNPEGATSRVGRQKALAQLKSKAGVRLASSPIK